MENLPLHHKLRLAAAVSLSGLVFYATAAAAVRAAAPPAKKGTPKAAAKTSAAPKPTSQTGFTDNTPLTERQKIVHLLNRAAFGPRPGDVERVRQMGIAAYIDEQLHPERISDAAVAAKIAPLAILQMPNDELTQGYFDALKTGKELKQLQAKLERQAKAQGTADGATMEMTPGGAAPAEETPEKKRQKLQAALLQMTPEEQSRVRELMQGARGKGVYTGTPQLIVAKTIRAVESPRQLQEVMVDFWTNHFNIDARKNACRVYKVSDDRDVIQKYTLAHFRDLLGASAKSPAMLVYLDNYQSTGAQVPDPAQGQRLERQKQRLRRMAAQGNATANENLARLEDLQGKIKKRKASGLNENYAREIMELHTLGVDGGYTQKDVTEVARCLTGWTIDRATGSFKFDARRHDSGEKTVLGQVIPAGGGIEDGEKVLDLLASSPKTMRHISYQLCQRLVADEPPTSLVNKCVATWQRTGGNLRSVVRTIVTSPEFFAPSAYKSKYKSPLEFVVSAIRAQDGVIVVPTGTEGPDGKPLPRNPADRVQPVVFQVGLLGQPLYQYQAPTGYPENSRKWVSSGAVIGRLNSSLSLAMGRIGGISFPAPETLSSGEAAGGPVPLVKQIISACVNDDLSAKTRNALLTQFADGAVDAPKTPQEKRQEAQRIVTFLIGSPDFQNH